MHAMWGVKGGVLLRSRMLCSPVQGLPLLFDAGNHRQGKTYLPYMRQKPRACLCHWKRTILLPMLQMQKKQVNQTRVSPLWRRGTQLLFSMQTNTSPNLLFQTQTQTCHFGSQPRVQPMSRQMQITNALSKMFLLRLQQLRSPDSEWANCPNRGE